MLNQKLMKLVQPICRARFESQDMDFIVSTLRGRQGRSDCLIELLGDEDDRNLLLDDEALLKALLETGGCVRVSTRFYFYVLVRHTLRRAGVEDRTIADYVAEMLSQFACTEGTRVEAGDQRLEYFFDMLETIQKADDRTQFTLRTHMANYALFLSGVFPERIEARAQLRGFPGLSYYIGIGSSQFKAAGDHRLARRYQLELILHSLSESFEQTRSALHEVAERLFTLGNTGNIDRLLVAAQPGAETNN